MANVALYHMAELCPYMIYHRLDVLLNLLLIYLPCDEASFVHNLALYDGVNGLLYIILSFATVKLFIVTFICWNILFADSLVGGNLIHVICTQIAIKRDFLSFCYCVSWLSCHLGSNFICELAMYM